MDGEDGAEGVDWCRACGSIASAGPEKCGNCGWPLSSPAGDIESPIGSVYAVAGKLKVTKRLGVCVGIDPSGLLRVHFGPDDIVELPGGSEPVDGVIDQALSPPSRLFSALRDLDSGAIKARWHREVIAETARQLASSSAATLRRTADEALAHGWLDVLGELPIRAEERAWRAAHHAAMAGDVSALRSNLERLPDAGFPTRCGLLLAHLAAITDDSDAWEPLVRRWASSGVPDAEEILLALTGADPRRSAELAIARLRSVDGAAAESCQSDFSELFAGRTPPAPAPECTTWTALSAHHAVLAGGVIGNLETLSSLPIELVDDLIDAGCIDAGSAFSVLPQPDYVAARVAPETLSLDELATVGHVGEIARRHFVARNWTALAALDVEHPDVKRLRALKKAVEGRDPESDDLDEDAARLLQLAGRARKALVDGATTALPGPIVSDPTLWTFFADDAQSGRLRPDSDDAHRWPVFAEWCSVQRLLGLIWSGELSAAVQLAATVISSSTSEQVIDECLNLSAYAKSQLGQFDGAADDLARALEGEYTENLLINACIVASYREPAVAVDYLTRLISEAPSTELRLLAVERAIGTWRATNDSDLPPKLQTALRNLLGERIGFDSYVQLLDLTALFDPRFVWSSGLINHGGPYSAPFRFYQSRARLIVDDNYRLSDHAEVVVQVAKTSATAAWFIEGVAPFFDFLRKDIFVDFGQAVHLAQAIDTIVVGAPEIFPGVDYFVLTPQAGAHIAAAFESSRDILSDKAIEKFFYDPIKRFHSDRSLGKIEPDVAEYLSHNFNIACFRAVAAYVTVARSVSAAEYNNLSAQRQRDYANVVNLTSRMRDNLNRDLQHVAVARKAVSTLSHLPHQDDEDRGRLQALTAMADEYEAESRRLLGRV